MITGDICSFPVHPFPPSFLSCSLLWQAFRRVSQAKDIAVNKAAETMTQLDQARTNVPVSWVVINKLKPGSLQHGRFNVVYTSLDIFIYL